ncbi:5'-(N(7)-methylguanosine 5'-triphospho)-[mRNA] hydrolase [Malassezia obtusa]|uniref:5'-(N(7)-methylguanosine 5'-triphospho)-[mRNA] hydrolase n=1 Tax=Malassezia obtusa TaxID=76774 RepID=A0AAF0DYN8_9BASI|nr:5'-(N(7)-methylguanosine 5'-triphospho)-[mRNA] hydrolase [Malassezia obtusa]
MGKHWFYLDFLCPLNPELPELNLRRFSEEILHVSSLVVPLIRLYMKKGPKSLELAFSQFMQYKTRVPVCGAILLNEDWTKCVLVKGWAKGASWTFPKGKINQDEPERDCALRELREETGFDATHLLPADSKDYLELTMREQKVRLYIVPGVSESTPMVTQTRREISRIEWLSLSDLPTGKKAQKPSPDLGGKFYLITPFVTRLRQWIQANKRTHPHKPPQTHAPQPVPETKAASAPGESISLETLFGAPTQSQVPGLIALPPSAQKQMAASRPQTPSSEQKKSAKASKAQSKTPKDVAKPPSDKDSSKLLLNLLHGSKPVPAPQAETDQSRVDGSTALRNLLGLESNPVSHTLQPSMPQARTTPQEHQAQLYSILGRPKQAPAQGHPHTGWPGVGLHQAQGQWSTMQSSTAHDQNVPVAENAPAPPSKDEHRNRLLSLLGGALPGAPPSRPPEAHGHRP